MKKIKFLSLIVCLLVALSGVGLVGCGKKSDDLNKPIAVINGFEINSIECRYDASIRELKMDIGITNKNEESVTFDSTQFHVVFEGEVLYVDGADRLFEAGQYIKLPMTIMLLDENLGVGDSVDVYYQDQLLKNVVVK